MKMNMIRTAVTMVVCAVFTLATSVVGQPTDSQSKLAAKQARVAQLEQDIAMIMPPPPSPAVAAKLAKKQLKSALNATSESEGNSPMAFQNLETPVGQNYAFTDLGVLLTNGRSIATGINSRGDVVGFASISDFFPDYGGYFDHAFLYTNGVMQDLGTLDGDYHSRAKGINDKGQVVGYSAPDPRYGATYGRAFVYQNGVMEDLSVLNGNPVTANAINNAGQIVGVGHAGPFLYSNGAIQNTPNLNSISGSLNAINNAGKIVGFHYWTSQFHASLYSEGVLTNLNDENVPGVVSPYLSMAKGINDRGQIVGEISIQALNSYHAFEYEDGVMQDLGTLGGSYSTANGINNSGQVVGNSRYATGGSRAFVYSGGEMQDLNNLVVPAMSGWTLGDATAINDVGQIVGIAINPSGRQRQIVRTC